MGALEGQCYLSSNWRLEGPYAAAGEGTYVGLVPQEEDVPHQITLKDRGVELVCRDPKKED